MTGIDLFKALGGVKEEYIAEADGSRKLPHVKNVTLQWCAALAACVCLLLGWGFIAQHLGGIADYTGDETKVTGAAETCLLYTSPSPRDRQKSRMPSSA